MEAEAIDIEAEERRTNERVRQIGAQKEKQLKDLGSRAQVYTAILTFDLSTLEKSFYTWKNLLRLSSPIGRLLAILLQFAYLYAFRALTLLAGHQGEHLACKKLSSGILVGYLSGARCK